MKYQANANFVFQEKRFNSGDILDIDDENEVARLVRCQVVHPFRETATAEPPENAMMPKVERRKRGRPRKNENNTI